MFAIFSDKLKDRLPPPPPPPTEEPEAGNEDEDRPNNEVDDSEEGDIGYHLLRQAAGQLLEVGGIGSRRRKKKTRLPTKTPFRCQIQT